MILCEIISFHYLSLFFFYGFFWLFLWECMLPWNQRFHVLYTELISAHRAAPPNLWTRLTEFDYITHPNTQTQWNTDMCTDTHDTHSYSVKISESSPWFCGEKRKKRSLTWVTRFCTVWLPPISSTLSQTTLIPQPLHFSHTNLLLSLVLSTSLH